MPSNENKDRAVQLRAAVDRVNTLITDLTSEGFEVEVKEVQMCSQPPHFQVAWIRRTQTEEL